MKKTVPRLMAVSQVSDTVAALRVAGRFYRFFVSGQLMNANAARSMRKVCGLGSNANHDWIAADASGQGSGDHQNLTAGGTFERDHYGDDDRASIVAQDEQGDHVVGDDQVEDVALPSVSRLKWEAIVNAGAFPFDDCATLMKAYRNGAARRVKSLAQQLPVHPWVSAIRGAGDLNLGLIIGETGDLSTYSNPAKLWKRMGLAVMADGRSHRRVKGEQTGYSPIRRTIMHNLGECLLKGNDGEMRGLYDTRKAYEIERNPEIKPIVAHKRALRYMEKRFLRDLWREWRRVTAIGVLQETNIPLPDPVSESVQAEATDVVVPRRATPKPARTSRREKTAAAHLSSELAAPDPVTNMQAEASIRTSTSELSPKPASNSRRRKAKLDSPSDSVTPTAVDETELVGV